MEVGTRRTDPKMHSTPVEFKLANPSPVTVILVPPKTTAGWAGRLEGGGKVGGAQEELNDVLSMLTMITMLSMYHAGSVASYIPCTRTQAYTRTCLHVYVSNT